MQRYAISLSVFTFVFILRQLTCLDGVFFYINGAKVEANLVICFKFFYKRVFLLGVHDELEFPQYF